MKLRVIAEGWERAASIKDDIKSGKYSFKYIARKHGVSAPYVTAVARRMGMGRGVRPAPRKLRGMRPAPLLSNPEILGVVR